MKMIPPGQIMVMEGFNLRVKGTKFHDEQVKKWADSIEAHGWFRDEPATCIVGKHEGKDVYFLVDGDTRMLALDLLQSQGKPIPEKIPVLLMPPETSVEDMTFRLMRSGTAKTPYELALGVQRLKAMGVDEKIIHTRVGITKRYMDELLSLLSAPAKIRNLLAANTISGTLAMQQIREKGKVGAAEDIGAAAEELAKEPAAKQAGKKAASGRITKSTIERVAARKQAATGAARAPKPGALNIALKAKPGDKLTLGAVLPFQRFYDGDWYDLDDAAGEVTIKARINFKITGMRTLPRAAVDTGGL